MVTWSKLFGLPYLIQIMQFCGSSSKFVGQTSQLFQENMEDKFNKGMSCITHFVLIHVILRTSQMLLVFSRHQMMYNVSYVVLCAEVTYKEYFVIQ